MNIIPEQETGTAKNILHSINIQSNEEAKSLYIKAKTRLYDINNWDKFAGTASAKFTLTDENGNTLTKIPEKNNLFKISIPAPGNKVGEGYDWVRIEVIEEHNDPENNYEFVVITVRPCESPLNNSTKVAHFFSDEATSSFVVQRKDKEVTACVLGRNEKPNTETEKIGNVIRNALVAVGAISGVANIQWNSLVKGLLA